MQYIKNTILGAAISLLLDTTVKGQRGGTGKTFDWNVAARFHKIGLPCFVAGGLCVDNVMENLNSCRPMGIDVNSGVEDRPGIKNERAIQTLLPIVHQFDKNML